jgi:hypothetical protein
MWPQQHRHHRSSNSQPSPPRTRRKAILFSIGVFLGMTFFSHQLENNLDHRLSSALPNNKALQLSSSSSTNNSNRNGIDNNKKVSYVTSFWAKKQHATKIIPHRKEIEAALLANIYNPYIDQVVVFLDGVTIHSENNNNINGEGENESSCVHFNQDMEELGRRFLEKRSSSHTNNNSNNNNPNSIGVDSIMSKVTCVNITTGQPTYHQMFLNTLSDVVTGDIVILANADMAFDDTISKARTLKEDVLVVLGTRGFSRDDMPISTREFYDIIVGITDDDLHITPQQRKDCDVDQCRINPWSWDTWIFHKQTLQGKLQEEFFQRPTKYRNHEMASFYMNENGAENAALWGLEQSYNFASVFNACDIIASWSFHLTSRTHHAQGQTRWPPGGGDGLLPNRVYVPKPWGGSKVRPRFNGVRMNSPPYPPKGCESSNGCFFD